MKLYYSPGACSLADHIALAEAGQAYDLVKVDLKAKTTEDGRDYKAINPKGYVPALELDDGEVLTENLAVLLYIADTAGALIPASGIARYRVIETGAFITTELHKAFGPIFKGGSDEDKARARDTIAQKLALLEPQVAQGGFVAGDAFTIADCYLFVMLSWCENKAKVPLPGALADYYRRIGERAEVKRALQEEGLA